MILATVGCATSPYRYGSGWNPDTRPPNATEEGPTDVVVFTGRPNKFIDGVGWVIGIPGKILLWDRRVNNHNVSDETTEEVVNYARNNNIDGVCVRINQYAPGDEWLRLCENKNVNPLWRYSVGTLTLVGYTILPGRIFGGDHYNPFTNSVYIYSDVPSLAIQSAAYGKDVQSRRYPGTYAAVNELPVISLWHETINTNDALGYIDASGDDDAQIEAIEILYPYYGTRVGGALSEFFAPEILLIGGGAVVGHISGHFATRNRALPSGSTQSDQSQEQFAPQIDAPQFKLDEEGPRSAPHPLEKDPT